MYDDEKLELAMHRAAQRDHAMQESVDSKNSTDQAVKYFQSKYNETHEPWVKCYWRPAMGWVYLITCVTDFIIFPIMWSLLQANYDGTITQQWSPITLLGGGLYHVAMGAIVSVTVYGRTQEKLSKKDHT
jgi:hypothetical protein